MQPHRANPNRMNDIKRKMVKSARQMVDKQLGTWTWVIFADVIDLVREAESRAPEAEVEKRAQQIWGNFCFPLDIYRTDEGSEKTMAEFIREWLHRGYSWRECIAHLDTLQTTASAKRELSDTFKGQTMKRLKECISKTYAGRDAQ